MYSHLTFLPKKTVHNLFSNGVWAGKPPQNFSPKAILNPKSFPGSYCISALELANIISGNSSTLGWKVEYESTNKYTNTNTFLFGIPAFLNAGQSLWGAAVLSCSAG